MRRVRRGLTFALGIVLTLIGLTVLAIRVTFGGGQRLDDRTTTPLVLAPFTEIVADLEYPPGNIAVSASGRIFITFHPDGGPPIKVVELKGVTPEPYPNEEFQTPQRGTPHFQSPLAVRVDRQERLWVLDHATYATGQPRLLAFDLATNQLVHRYEFPADVAPWLSMLNDFQVDPEGKTIYIAETSPFRQRPALVVYDVAAQTSRRVLHNHPSVQTKDFIIQAPGRDMILYHLATLRIAVDSIALDQRGEWLYYGPVTGDRLYRVATADLNNTSLTPEDLGAKVEDYGPKPISDGLSTDELDNVYLTDPEHSAVLRLRPDRTLETVVKDSPLRWPDGLSFGPDGWLYVSCSALHHYLFLPAENVRTHAPYQIIRFKPGPKGVPGH